MNNTPLSATALEALRLVEMGYLPIPIPPRSKGPNIPKWPEYRLAPGDTDQAARDFPEGSNIGILLGHDGLVCVDLDHETALELAPQFLPKTGCILGRTGRPACHWFYRIMGEAPRTKHFPAKIAGKSINLMDRLGLGSQVLVGPSVHPSGAIYDSLSLAGTPAEREEPPC